MNINGIEFNPCELMSKDELLDYLKQNGNSDRALTKIRESQYEKYGNELIWRYPISDGKHLGTFIIIVKEGFLSVPFDAIDNDDYELLEIDDASMFNAEAMQIFINDWMSFSIDLFKTMKDMLSVLSDK